MSFEQMMRDDRAQIIAAYRHHALPIIGGSLLLNLFGVLTPVYSMLIYDKVVGNNVPETLAGLTIGVVLVALINFVLRLLRSYHMERIFCGSDERIDQQLSKVVVGNQNGAVHSSGRFISRYHDLLQTRDVYSASYMMALVDIPFLLLYLLLLAVIGGPLIWWVIFMVAAVAVFSLAVKKPANAAGVLAQRLEAQRLSLLAEMINHADLLKVSPLRQFMFARWEALSVKSAQARSHSRFYHAMSYAGIGDGMTLLWIGTICFGALLAEGNSLSIGGLSACSLLSSRIGSAVGAFIVLLGRYELFAKARQEFVDSVQDEQADTTAFMPPRHLQGVMGVEGLKFHFPQRSQHALDDVSFRVQPGEKLGILGRNGSGKSTLLRCMTGALKSQSGQVTVDGVNLLSFDPAWRARWLSYKPQDALLFEGTLEDNIRCGEQSEHVETLHAALQISGLAEDIARGEMTLDKPVFSGGQNLSGGQRQAVALARALLPDPQILILDEPTAGLDQAAEKAMIERLLPACANKTLIISTHSLELLRRLDRIIVIEKGRIIADGPTHQIIVGAA